MKLRRMNGYLPTFGIFTTQHSSLAEATVLAFASSSIWIRAFSVSRSTAPSSFVVQEQSRRGGNLQQVPFVDGFLTIAAVVLSSRHRPSSIPSAPLVPA